MSGVFAMFLEQFVAPIPIAVGIAGAFFSRSWLHVLMTAIAAASITQIFLRMSDAEHSFNLLTFLIGVVAAGIWAAWFYWVRLSRTKNN